jgi:rubrerythrin
MTQEQTICDAIRLAVRREEQAYSFLTAMSRCVQQAAVKSVLEDFARQELEHKDKLELELMKLGEVVPSGQTQEESNNPYYIEAEECTKMDYSELLRFCIEKEDISFRLYIDLASQMQRPLNKEVFIALAEEELRHKLRFEAMYDALLEGI